MDIAKNKFFTQETRRNLSWVVITITPVIYAWFVLAVADLTFTGMRVGLSPAKVLFIISSSAFVSMPLLLFPSRLRKYAATFLLLFFTLLIFADILHFRYFGTIVSFWEFVEIGQVPLIMPSIQRLVSLEDAWLLFLIFAVAIFIKVCPTPQRIKAPPRRLVLAWHITIFLFFSSVSFYCYDILNSEWKLPIISIFCSPKFYLEKRGLINAHLDDLMLLMWELKAERTITKDEKEKINDFLASRGLKEDIPTSLYGITHGKNVIFIQVESLQAWLIDSKIGSQEITPFLNRLSREALYYPHIFDQTLDGRSSDADFVVLNSLYPLNYGNVAFRRTYNNFLALPLLLRDAGYTTFSSSGYGIDFWNIGTLHFRFGIEKSIFKEGLGNGETFPDGYISDGYFFKRIAPELTKLNRPFFALLTTISSHVPYRIPEEFHILNPGPFNDTLLGDYLQSIRYIDECLKDFFIDLEKNGILEESIIVIYGDHDWGFLDSKELMGFLGYKKGHSSSQILLDRIPLFIVFRQAPLRGKISVVGGHSDIAPTLLYLLGIKQPPSFLGEPLLPHRQNIVTITHPWGSVVTDKRIFVNEADTPPGKNRCFSFPSGEPLEDKMCDGLEKKGIEELEVSQAIVLYDLAREVSGYNAEAPKGKNTIR